MEPTEKSSREENNNKNKTDFDHGIITWNLQKVVKKIRQVSIAT